MNTRKVARVVHETIQTVNAVLNGSAVVPWGDLSEEQQFQRVAAVKHMAAEPSNADDLRGKIAADIVRHFADHYGESEPKPKKPARKAAKKGK